MLHKDTNLAFFVSLLTLNTVENHTIYNGPIVLNKAKNLFVKLS